MKKDELIAELEALKQQLRSVKSDSSGTRAPVPDFNRVSSFDGMLEDLREYQENILLENDRLLRQQDKLEKSRNKFARLYDFAPVGYIILNRFGEMLEANLTAAALFKTERVKLYNRSITEFIDRSEHKKFLTYLSSLFKNSIMQNLELLMRDNVRNRFHARIEGIIDRAPDGEIIANVTITDITETKMLQEELRHTRKLLETKLEYLTSPGSKLEGINISHLIDLKRLQTLQDSFAEVFGFVSIVTDTKGEKLTKFSDPQGIMDINTGNTDCCLISDEQFAGKAFNENQPVYERCSGCGRYVVCAPIIVAEKHFANWFVFMEPDALPDKFDYKDSGMISIDKVIDLVWNITREISNLAYKNLTLTKSLKDLDGVHKELKTNEERFRSIFDNASIGVFQAGPDGHIFMANPAFVNLLGYTSYDDLSDLKLADIHLDEYTRDELFRELRRSKIIKGFETQITRKDDVNIFVRINIRLLRSTDSGDILIEGAIEDITQKKTAEINLEKNSRLLQELVDKRTRELKNRDEHLRAINESTQVGLFIFKNGKVIYANPALEHITGFSGKEILDKDPLMILDDANKAIVMEYMKKRLEGDKAAYRYVVKINTKDRKNKWLDMHTSPVELWDEPAAVVTAIDITDRMKFENDLKVSLKEKENLISEIHHRVKNNLQLMSSMLSLQTHYIDEQNPKEAFRLSIERIKLLARIHEKLYKSRNFGEINIGDYIREMATDLVIAYQGNKNLELELNVENTFFEFDTAITFGLLLNELITNCVKHAFPDRNKGSIYIEFRKIEIDKYIFVFRDNGIGMPADFSQEGSSSYGMLLIENFVRELFGEMQINSDGGTEFRVSFSPKKKSRKSLYH